MSESLKAKTLQGAIWTLLERLGTQVVGFAVTIVLARLLTPSDYGVIGMIAVFMSISQMFIDCGFGSALIRKRNRTNVDYSTVFWFNLGAAFFFYGSLFFAAPFIARYYHMPILTGILRVIGVNLIIYALYTVQVTRFTAEVNFKPQAKVAVSSCILSGAVGIALAYLGCGPWALVGQQIFSAVFSGSLYWTFSGWHPNLVFSFPAFKELFGFSSKIVAASFLHTIYANISPIIIGRKYTAADLGFYSRAEGLVLLPEGIFQGTLGRVIFPVLSSVQSDEMRLRAAYNKYLRLMTSIVAASMLLLAACAEPLVVVLIGEKWLPCVPYLQLLALDVMVDPMIRVNLNVLYVKGRSDVVLKLEVIKKIIAIAIVVTAVQYGVLWLCVGRVVYAYIALVLNLYFCGPFIGMSFWRQMREVAPIYLAAFFAAGISYILAHLGHTDTFIESAFPRNFVALAVAGCAGAVSYLMLAWALKFDLISEGLQILAKARNRVK